MTSTLKLWELSDELEQIGYELQEAGGEISDTLAERLAALEGQWSDKAANVALYIRNCELTADAAREEERRLADIRRSNENAAAGLRRYLLEHMASQGLKKVETPLIRVTVQRNSQPSISQLTDEIPERFTKYTPSLDKRAVLEEWEGYCPNPADRPQIEGFDITYGNHIRIK